MTMRTMKSAGAGLLATLLASCAGTLQPDFPLPDEPGLYALDSNDDLHRLDGDREWEVKSWPARAAMGAYTEFVIFDPDLKRDARPRENLVSLWRVAWVRSEVDRRGLAGPVQGSEWAVAPLEPFHVPVTVRSADGYPAYVHLRPGGAAIFAPDGVRDDFTDATELLECTRGSRAMRGVQWTWDPDPSDDTVQTDYAFVLRDGTRTEVAHEIHVSGMFPRATWLDLLSGVGFKTELIERPLDDEGRTDLIFLGIK